MQPTTKFEDLSKVIKEDYSDEMIPDVYRDQLGLKTEYPAGPSNVKDMFNKNKRTDIAPENIPYPLNNFDEVVSNAFVSLQNLENLLKMANTNTVIKDKSPIDKIGKEIVQLKGKLVDISKKVSKIK